MSGNPAPRVQGWFPSPSGKDAGAKSGCCAGRCCQRRERGDRASAPASEASLGERWAGVIALLWPVIPALWLLPPYDDGTGRVEPLIWTLVFHAPYALFANAVAVATYRVVLPPPPLAPVLAAICVSTCLDAGFVYTVVASMLEARMKRVLLPAALLLGAGPIILVLLWVARRLQWGPPTDVAGADTAGTAGAGGRRGGSAVNADSTGSAVGAVSSGNGGVVDGGGGSAARVQITSPAGASALDDMSAASGEWEAKAAHVIVPAVRAVSPKAAGAVPRVSPRRASVAAPSAVRARQLRNAAAAGVRATFVPPLTVYKRLVAAFAVFLGAYLFCQLYTVFFVELVVNADARGDSGAGVNGTLPAAGDGASSADSDGGGTSDVVRGVLVVVFQALLLGLRFAMGRATKADAVRSEYEPSPEGLKHVFVFALETLGLCFQRNLFLQVRSLAVITVVLLQRFAVHMALGPMRLTHTWHSFKHGAKRRAIEAKATAVHAARKVSSVGVALTRRSLASVRRPSSASAGGGSVDGGGAGPMSPPRVPAPAAAAPAAAAAARAGGTPVARDSKATAGASDGGGGGDAAGPPRAGLATPSAVALTSMTSHESASSDAAAAAPAGPPSGTGPAPRAEGSPTRAAAHAAAPVLVPAPAPAPAAASSKRAASAAAAVEAAYIEDSEDMLENHLWTKLAEAVSLAAGWYGPFALLRFGWNKALYPFRPVDTEGADFGHISMIALLFVLFEGAALAIVLVRAWIVSPAMCKRAVAAVTHVGWRVKVAAAVCGIHVIQDVYVALVLRSAFEPLPNSGG